MTYIPTDWKIGDTITANKLNKLENAVASSSSTSSGLLVTISGSPLTMDKTAGEIINAVENGVPVTFINIQGQK